MAPFANEKEVESDGNKKIPVTIQVITEQGQPFLGVIVFIVPIIPQELKEEVGAIPIQKLADKQRQVAYELESGSKYSIEVYAKKKEITVPDHPITVTITVDQPES